MVWTGFIWLKTATFGGLFEHGNEELGFHKILGNSSVAERLVVSHEGLSSMDLDRQIDK
jgi:hypothetical protein